jgi:serpin B
VLPSKVDGLPALEERFARGALPEWIGSLRPDSVEVWLPRFKISATFSLAETLKRLGMHAAFAWPGADFSGVDGSKDLVISEVLHQAVVEVEEKGTEAAAATAVVMRIGALGAPRSVLFRADRPFLFLIRDAESGELLFVGRLVRP